MWANLNLTIFQYFYLIFHLSILNTTAAFRHIFLYNECHILKFHPRNIGSGIHLVRISYYWIFLRNNKIRIAHTISATTSFSEQRDLAQLPSIGIHRVKLASWGYKVFWSVNWCWFHCTVINFILRDLSKFLPTTRPVNKNNNCRG